MSSYLDQAYGQIPNMDNHLGEALVWYKKSKMCGYNESYDSKGYTCMGRAERCRNNINDLLAKHYRETGEEYDLLWDTAPGYSKIYKK